MKEIVIATTNEGKRKEFMELLRPMGFVVTSLKDYPQLAEIEETGTTFEENAIIKAESVAKQLHKTTLADDSGLEIRALNGQPGVYSARYLGKDTSYEIKNQKIVEQVKDASDRSCRYVCAIAFAKEGTITKTVNGVLEGEVAQEPKGTNGFGYDPIFYLPSYQKTVAQLDEEEKNAISHRSIAFRKLRNLLDGENK